MNVCLVTQYPRVTPNPLREPTLTTVRIPQHFQQFHPNRARRVHGVQHLFGGHRGRRDVLRASVYTQVPRGDLHFGVAQDQGLVPGVQAQVGGEGRRRRRG